MRAPPGASATAGINVVAVTQDAYVDRTVIAP
jgi:hypothetical protein